MEWYYKFLPVNESGNFDFNAYIERTSNAEHNVWMPILIVVCILAIWFICKFVRKLHGSAWYSSDSLLRDDIRMGNTMLIAVTSILVIIYVMVYGSSALWFMFPGKEGNWVQVIVCGIIYIYALINFLVGYLKTLDDFCQTPEGRVNLKCGLLTLAIGLLAMMACAVSAPDYLLFVVLALVVCQLIQLWMIFSWAANESIASALIACGIYLLGGIAVIAFAIPFFLLMIVLAVMLFSFVFILKSSLEEDKKRTVIRYDNGRIVDKDNGTEYIENPDGTLSPRYP